MSLLIGKADYSRILLLYGYARKVRKTPLRQEQSRVNFRGANRLRGKYNNVIMRIVARALALDGV